nr:hypothetical protein [Tanacetum cinerariifolium]
ELASPLRDVSEDEACPTDSGFEADQDRANIAKSSTLPHDLAPRVTSPAADEGCIQLKLNELTALCTSLQRQHLEMVAKFEEQELEIHRLKARVKLLEDREGLVAEQFRDDTPIKRRNLDEGEAAAERVSDDTEDMATVLTFMDATTVLASGVAKVPTSSGSIPTDGPPAAEVPTGKSETPKKKKFQEQLDIQMARQLEEEMERKDQRMSEQIARDAKVARIHAEEELQMMINSLDRSNETVLKYLQEYKQFAEDLSIGERVELINDMIKYQENYAQILKYQTQQRKPWSKKQKRDYYMVIIKSNLGWKESVKKLKTSEEVPEEVKSHDEVPKEKVKEMMQLVPIKEVYVEALQVKHHIIDWKVHTEGQRRYQKITRLGGSSASYQFFVDMLKHLDREDLNQLWALVKESLSIRPPTSDKEIELWVELKRLYELNDKDQLWTHTQNLMHAPVEWKLYDTCGVHHVTAKDKEIFMLVEKDYPLRKEFATQTHGYDTWQGGESNLLATMAMIEDIVEHPNQQDTQLTSMIKKYWGNDHVDEDEEHFIGICLQNPQTQHIPCDICFCEECLNEARILEDEPLNQTRHSNKPRRSKHNWSTLGEPSGRWDYYVKYDALINHNSSKIIFPLTTEKLFAKLPPSLSKKIEESFKAKYHGLNSGVLPAIKFTHTFVLEMCKDAALAKELRDLSLCLAIRIPGYYKNNRKKYGMRKSRTYNGKPHNSHDIISAEFDDISVYSISEGEGDIHQSISVMVQDALFEEAAFMVKEEVNEGDSEDEN